MSTEKAKAKQIQVDANAATPAGTLQELIETRKILPTATTALDGAMSKEDKVKLQDLPTNSELVSALDSRDDTLNARIDSEVDTLDTRITDEVSALNDRVDTEAGTLDSRITSEVAGITSDLAGLTADKYDKSGGHISGDVSISGKLTVQGGMAEVEAEHVSTSDTIIRLNDGEAGTGVTNGFAGIEIDRGTEIDYEFGFNESTKLFEVGEVGDRQPLLTRMLAPVANKFFRWNDTTKQAETADITWGGVTGKLSDVSKAEAEAGTNTTTRFWSSLRVREAILGWWNTSSSKTKLDGIQAGAQVNVATNIAQGTRTATTVPITSSTGSNATLQAASTTLAGVMTSTDKTKLDGIAAGAQVNSVTSVAGKTGAVTVTKADVGLSNVTNTSDAAKPVSTAQQAALDLKADKTTQVIAGTGLTGGGTLAANRTLNVSYGTTAGTAAQGNDARLSDSREWSASTISQAEAEAGTATTRRAFTAQRVRQAIVAWFSGISGALGRTILTRTTAAQVRGDIGLGTAATKDVGEGVGNVLGDGNYGFGYVSKYGYKGAISGSGFYSWDGDVDRGDIDGIPDGINPNGAMLLNIPWTNGTSHRVQFWAQHINNNFYLRRKVSGILQDPVLIHHTGNIRTSTGTSTEYPMSQKAVTDALSTKAASSHTHPLSQITGAGNLASLSTNASTSNFLRGDGTWATPPNTNTTYSEITTAEIDAGTASTLRTITGRRMKHALDKKANASHTHSTSQITGLGTAATKNVGTGSGNVMEVGAFGAGHTFPAVTFDANLIADQVGGKSGFYPQMSNSGSTNVPHTYVYIQQLFFSSNGNVTQIAYGYNIEKIWIRYRYSGTWSDWREVGGSVSWSEVTSKPSSFTPSSHTHASSDITGLGNVAALNTNANTANFLRGDGTWATPPNTNTTYTEITTAIIDAGTSSALHTISGRRMKYALDKKADASHTHSWSEVTGVPIVQTTGTSTTNIMSQKAVNDIVKATKLALGSGTNATGYYSTALGVGAIATGESSTALGRSSYAPGNSSTALGHSAIADGDRQIQIGLQSGTNMPDAVYSAKAITVRSDQNDKSDIRDIDLGLNFIMQLRPVKFKYDYQSEYLPEIPDDFYEWSKEDQDDWHEDRSNMLNNGLVEKDGTHKGFREQEGFLYQQVKAVADSMGTDFSGLVDATVNGGSKYANKSLAHEKFIAPMVKAIQEQQSMIEALTARLDALESK